MKLWPRAQKILQLPPRIFLFYLLFFVKQKLRFFWFSVLCLPAIDCTSLFVSERRVEQLRKTARSRFLFSPDDREEMLKMWRTHIPAFDTKIITDANAICRHEFEFLGSGRKVLGSKISWHTDWQHGKTWPKAYVSSASPLSVPGQGELKLPWELSRFYHAVTLGQAYWLSGDEKYAQEFVAQFNDWERENPVYRSVNWSNAMEASIRLANLIMGWFFFLDSPYLASEFHRRFIGVVWRHGSFIMHNLEKGILRANHYFADLIGAIYLGVVFPELPRTKHWRNFCLREFEREILHQFYEDGAHFEASLSYHRLTAETAQWVVELCKRAEIRLNAQTLTRLARIYEFTLWYTKPNGLAPQIGDNDDGRIHRFEGIFDVEMRDHRHLLMSAGIATPSSLPSRGFINAGIYVMRSLRDFCIVDAGENGQEGWGGHSHNDTLSFELCMGGEDLIVDPGTYVYTSDAEARNLFRSTAMHNGVRVDREEINLIPQDNLFGLPEVAHPRVLLWRTNTSADELIVEHYGYRRFPQRVIHRRRFLFDKVLRALTIEDTFSGTGVHLYEWFFHFAEGVAIKLEGTTLSISTPRGARYLMRCVENTPTLAIEQGWISPSYGVRAYAAVAHYTLRALAGNVCYRTVINPNP